MQKSDCVWYRIRQLICIRFEPYVQCFQTMLYNDIALCDNAAYVPNTKSYVINSGCKQYFLESQNPLLKNSFQWL